MFGLDDLFGQNKSSNKPIFAEDMAGTHSKTGRVLRVTYSPDPEIQAWRVEGRTAGFGTFDTKREAVKKARQVFGTDDMYRGIRIHNKNGGLNTNQSVGDWEL